MSRVISVVGTAGGVGASVLSAALACRASYLGAAVVAVDCRPFGGGLDIVFGVDEEPGVRWRDLVHAVGEVDGADLFGRLPLAGRCGVLSFDRDGPVVPPDDALAAAVAALRRISDIVVVDAPRAGEVWEEQVADLSDDVIALTGTTVSAIAAAGAGVPHLDAVHDGLWLACRTDRRNPDLPENLSALLDTPLLGGVASDTKVPVALDEGRPPPSRGAFTRSVDALLGALTPLRSPR